MPSRDQTDGKKDDISVENAKHGRDRANKPGVLRPESKPLFFVIDGDFELVPQAFERGLIQRLDEDDSVPFRFDCFHVHTAVRLTDRALTRAAPSRASGKAARPRPRLMVAPEGANCSGRDAVQVGTKEATSVPGQRTAPRRVQRRVRRLATCTEVTVGAQNCVIGMALSRRAGFPC